MRMVLNSLAFSAALLTASTPAFACPPPPPGWVPPTDEERLRSFARDVSDIVYGVVTRTGAPGDPITLEVLHVYKGGRAKGDTVEAPSNWDYPVPVCAGMMTPPPSKPVGAYGVFAFRAEYPGLVLIKPDDVQAMIRHGLIRSARAG